MNPGPADSLKKKKINNNPNNCIVMLDIQANRKRLKSTSAIFRFFRTDHHQASCEYGNYSYKLTNKAYVTQMFRRANEETFAADAKCF